MGAIHGNEKCGTIAIDRVMQEIDTGHLKIVKGEVTFIPISNPKAYEIDQRYYERNLNRYFVPTENPDCYEAKLANILCPILARCDVHLSIHSYTVGGAPFIFVSPTDKREHDFATALGPHTLLTGWTEAYAATGRKAVAMDENEGVGTVEWARRCGAIGVDIECGQHKDPLAPGIAYDAIRNALRYLEIIGEPKQEIKAPEKTQLVTMSRVYYRDDAGNFTKSWKHLEPVKKGEALALRADGTPVVAPDDGYVIMPKDNAPIGEEWFYFGT